MSSDKPSRDALSLLFDRHSTPVLQDPAPSGDDLDTIFRAALHVPDHHHLRPYRFLVAAGEGRDRLGAMMQDAARLRGEPPAVVERAVRMPLRAPMVITVVAKAIENDVVPLFDQQLTAGCTVLALQMAAQALGYGGIWRSGWLMYDRSLHTALGLDDKDQIVGFLYLGTPKAAGNRIERDDNPEKLISWI